ncbi:Origin recognition complex subunit 2 [Podila humilis]|nr:Origin recognition complex subunit 2 [Podila humilis]
MVCLVYQRNDEIPIHIINKVSNQDAELELALAKKRRRVITTITDDTEKHSNHNHHNNTTRTSRTSKRNTSSLSSSAHHHRRLNLVSGLTVSKPSTSSASAKVAAAASSSSFSVPVPKEEDPSLQDIFLPMLSSTQTHTSSNNNSNSTKSINTKDGATTTAGDGDDDNGPIVQHTLGREVFGFQSSRKPTGLQSILDQKTTVSEPQEQQQQKPTNTKSRRKGNNVAIKKEAHKAEEEEDEEEMTQERHSRRRKVAQTISRLNKAGSDDDDEEESDEQEDDDDDEEEQNQTRPSENDFDQARDIMDAKPAVPTKSIFEEDEMGAERYFQDLYQKSRTSNNTLSKLPTLDHGDFVQALKRAPVKHASEMEMLTLLYEEQFPQWYFELVSGFNLLIYGYGSKRQLLTKFATTMLTDGPLIIVNGYFPTLNLKDILEKILTTALEYTTGPFGTLQEQIAFIHGYFQQPDRAVEKLYLLVHNIDGSGLRSEKAQATLSQLASCPKIHLVASIDHINANILWDTVKTARFRWCWHELTTFRSYLAETSFENSMMVRQGELGARGVQFVLASLTSNGRGLFKVLAEHQIQNEKDAVATSGAGAGAGAGGGGGSTTSSAKSTGGGGNNQADLGMAYNVLFKKCQENFLVSNAVTFRSQLTEFRDHRIVQSKKGADGVEILYIPLSGRVLEGILETM